MGVHDDSAIVLPLRPFASSLRLVGTYSGRPQGVPPLELSLAWRVVPPLLLHSGTSKENVPPFFDCPTPGGQASQKVVPGGVGHFVTLHCTYSKPKTLQDPGFTYVRK